MKIRLEKPAVNNLKAYGWQNGYDVDKWFSNSNFIT